jgi:hypothetical protein
VGLKLYLNNGNQNMKITSASALTLVGMAISTWAVTGDDKWDITKVDLGKLPAAADKQAVTYAKDIRPLFEASCFGCHGEEKAKGELRLDSLAAVLKGGEDGKMVNPGDSEKSLLVASVAQIHNEIAMPPKRGQGGPGKPGGRGNRPSEAGGGAPPSGGSGGPGGPNRVGGGGFGPPPKPLTSEQVGLIRAWIDQGAK